MARLLPDAIFHVGCGRVPRIAPRFSWRLAQGPLGVGAFTRGSAVPSCTRGGRTWPHMGLTSIEQQVVQSVLPLLARHPQRTDDRALWPLSSFMFRRNVSQGCG